MNKSASNFLNSYQFFKFQNSRLNWSRIHTWCTIEGEAGGLCTSRSVDLTLHWWYAHKKWAFLFGVRMRRSAAHSDRCNWLLLRDFFVNDHRNVCNISGKKQYDLPSGKSYSERWITERYWRNRKKREFAHDKCDTSIVSILIGFISS